MADPHESAGFSLSDIPPFWGVRSEYFQSALRENPTLLDLDVNQGFASLRFPVYHTEMTEDFVFSSLGSLRVLRSRRDYPELRDDNVEMRWIVGDIEQSATIRPSYTQVIREPDPGGVSVNILTTDNQGSSGSVFGLHYRGDALEEVHVGEHIRGLTKPPSYPHRLPPLTVLVDASRGIVTDIKETLKGKKPCRVVIHSQAPQGAMTRGIAEVQDGEGKMLFYTLGWQINDDGITVWHDTPFGLGRVLEGKMMVDRAQIYEHATTPNRDPESNELTLPWTRVPELLGAGMTQVSASRLPENPSQPL